MSQSLIRCLAVGALAIPTVAVVAGTATPAHAIGSSVRVARSSLSNTLPVKTARVVCPDGMRAYSGGGAVDYGPAGGTGAALTAITPDSAERAILVTAKAPPGQTGEWSVVAYAVCSSSVEPLLVVHKGLGTAVADCPEYTGLFGVGFDIAADPSDAHVTGVTMNSELTRVRVTAGGPHAATTLVTATAACRYPSSQQRQVTARNAGAGWPKVVAGQDTEPDLSTYPVGAAVTGPESATLDAIVPGADDGITWARGTLFGAAAGSRAADDGDGSVTVEAGLIGTFH